MKSRNDMIAKFGGKQSSNYEDCCSFVARGAVMAQAEAFTELRLTLDDAAVYRLSLIASGVDDEDLPSLGEADFTLRDSQREAGKFLDHCRDRIRLRPSEAFNNKIAYDEERQRLEAVGLLTPV
jgi:hypothetical protein